MKIITPSFSRLFKFSFAAMFLLVACATQFDTAQCLAQRRGKTTTVAPRTISIPRGTTMKVRLETEVDSKKARDGDPIRATVLTPSRYADSTVEGYISSVKQSGKIKGKSSLVLVFDRIRLNNGGNQPFRAEVTKIYGEKSVKDVDEEGNIKGSSRGESTAKRTAGGAVAGAVIGGIIGGGKGAAIGAGIGAGAGAGSNVIRGSSQVKLDEGTEMLIRTTH
jgi:hypothetical protein